VRSRKPLDHYVLAVSAAGLALLAFGLTRLDITEVWRAPIPFLLFATFVVVGEFVPIKVRYRDEVVELTITTTFAFALMLASGTPVALIIFALASVGADIRQRKPASKVVFNAAQYTLSLGIAGAVYELLSGGQPLSAQLAQALVAALVFFLLNHSFVGVAIGLAQGSGILQGLRQVFAAASLSSGMLLAMAPAAVVVAETSALLVPTLIVPTAAVYLAASAAASANERRAEAEAAARQAREMAAEQARLAKAEQAVVRELEAADRIKSDLLETVSHELRSPLTTILGALTTLAAHDGRLSSEDRADLLEMSSRQGQRLRRLIEQLLLAAQLDRAALAAPVGDLVELVELTRQAVMDAEDRHAGRKIHVSTTGPVPVRADPAALTQILDNLLDNACKYSPEGRPVKVSVLRNRSLAVVAVEDSGPGVPRHDRERIFERFSRVDEREDVRSGVGLGLYIARQLARGQGGEVLVGEVRSDSGGARFELRLPVAGGAAQAS
jgi:K+-sensing histidine kinase KdpD